MYSSGILTGGNRHTWSVAAIAGIRQGRLPRHTWSGCLLPRHLKHALDGTFLAHVSWPIGCYIIVRIVRLPRSRPRRACIRNTFLMLRIMRAGFLDLTLRAAPYLKFHIDENLKKELTVLELIDKAAKENAELDRQRAEQAATDNGQQTTNNEHQPTDTPPE